MPNSLNLGRLARILLAAAVLSLPAAPLVAQCPPEQLENFTGGGTVGCSCFVPNEEAGAIFELAPADYPIEILKVGIGWGSQFGGAPDSLENAIRIYAGGLPDPGEPIFSLPGPQLVDGVINDFDLEPIPGEIVVDSGPFTVTLNFLNQNAGDIFAPTVVHDGNGCTPGQNAVLAVPGGWADACPLGVTGDWVFYVVYRKLGCTGGGSPASVPDGNAVPGTPLTLDRAGTGQVTLSWDDSCSAGDTDYEIYSGFLGAFYSHFSVTCTTGGSTTETISAGNGDRYYLVVPTDGTDEGSYGIDSEGGRRPPGGGGCRPQQVGSCR